jgi:hypothetical protein
VKASRAAANCDAPSASDAFKQYVTGLTGGSVLLPSEPFGIRGNGFGPILNRGVVAWEDILRFQGGSRSRNGWTMAPCASGRWNLFDSGL